jgi:hypothetical protein
VIGPGPVGRAVRVPAVGGAGVRVVGPAVRAVVVSDGAVLVRRRRVVARLARASIQLATRFIATPASATPSISPPCTA